MTIEAGAATAQIPTGSATALCGMTIDSIVETFKLSVGLEGAAGPPPPSEASDIDLARRLAPARIISALSPARRTLTVISTPVIQEAQRGSAVHQDTYGAAQVKRSDPTKAST